MINDNESDRIIEAHLPCPNCGSHDALTRYADGHSYCFSCQTYTKGDINTPSKTPTKKDFKAIEDSIIEPLPIRKLTATTCRRYGYSKGIYGEHHCQIAPYYADNGKLLGQKLRFKDKHFCILGNLHNRFFGQHLFNGGKKLVVTEGEIDCLTVSQITGNKYPVVSIPNGCQSAKHTFEANLEWLNNFEEVIVMFDMDEPGRKATQAVTKVLPIGKLKIATLPLKDPNECLKSGCPDKVLQAIWNAKAYRPDGIVNGNELWEALNADDDNEQGYSLPWDLPLSKMTLGLRKGELIVITAGTGVGKTTFVRQIAHHLGCKLKLKVGMMMLEENIKRTAKGLMGVHCGKRLALNKYLLSPEDYKKCYEETLGSGNFVFYEHFGSLESDNLMSKMRYLAVAEKCDFIVLDHITIAISGLDIDNERKATDVLMTQLRSLAEETGVGMLIISHLKRTEGTPAEEGGIISLSHLRGSHALAQLSDGVWALERNQQAKDSDEKNTVRVRVLKNRETGETGIAGYLKYNKDTDRLDAAKAPKKTVENPFIDKGDF